MSLSTGRMSRQEALRTLTEIHATIQEFTGLDAPEAVHAEADEISQVRDLLQDWLDTSSAHLPDAAAIRTLRARLAALQWDRFLNSQQQDPRHTLAAVITLYGQQADELPTAAALAARDLGCPVRLQDSSHVRTATLTGTRYIFTTHAP